MDQAAEKTAAEKTAGQKAYAERLKRLVDAVELREPDRVPVSLGLSYFPAKFAGGEAWDAFYDFPKWRAAYLAAAREYEPDRLLLVPSACGHTLEAVEARQTKWPGHGVARHHTHQFVEGEYMKEDEYDHFLDDMSDFLVRVYLPRAYGIMGPLGQLPPLTSLYNMLPYSTLASDDFVKMLETLTEAARETVRWQQNWAELGREVEEAGFFCAMPLMGVASPFDMISDFLRGMRGAMLDMFRRPEKLERACQKMCRLMLERITATPAADGFQPVFMPLHRGAHGFMSLQQFERYYWPYLKAVCLALIEKGYTPDLFFEGDYNSRLEYIAELPRGKAIARFDQVDMAKAKEIVGKTICIAGNMPVSTLQMGTKADVERECRRILDAAAPGGGFMMSPASSLDEVNPENMRVWIDCTKTYGKY
jgi:hypothetical protein